MYCCHELKFVFFILKNEFFYGKLRVCHRMSMVCAPCVHGMSEPYLFHFLYWARVVCLICSLPCPWASTLDMLPTCSVLNIDTGNIGSVIPVLGLKQYGKTNFLSVLILDRYWAIYRPCADI